MEASMQRSLAGVYLQLCNARLLVALLTIRSLPSLGVMVIQILIQDGRTWVFLVTGDLIGYR